MRNYFEEVIFPPLPKPIHITEKYDIDNNPMNKTPMLVDFWFVEIAEDKTTRLQLMTACPICDTTYVMRHDVTDKEMMKHALKSSMKFYIGYIKDHCPKCYPGNPIVERNNKGEIWK